MCVCMYACLSYVLWAERVLVRLLCGHAQGANNVSLSCDVTPLAATSSLSRPLLPYMVTVCCGAAASCMLLCMHSSVRLCVGANSITLGVEKP